MTEKPEPSTNSSTSARETLANRYEIVCEIGTGGMGTVYKAFDIKLKRDLALKILNPDRVSDQHLVRLHNEARTICQLLHPNIVNIYDFILHENEPIMVMEFIDARSLMKIVVEDGPLSLARSVEIFQQICDAMEYAHQHGILHRDLTANNILVSDLRGRKPTVKVVDFGVAKISSFEKKTITKSGFIVGTAYVLSPEQARGEETDARSDVYSLGCLMYYCLTGRYPFNGDSFMDIATKQVTESPPTLQAGNESIEYPQELEELIARTLEKDPDFRFQSMAELSDSLDSLEELIALNKTLILAPEPQSKSSRSHPDFLLVATALVIAFAIGLFTYWTISQEKPVPEEKTRAPLLTSRPNLEHINGEEWIVLKNLVTKSTFIELESYSNVKRLQLSNAKFEEDDLQYIVNKDLVVLDLTGTDITDKSLELISKIKSLQSLILSDCSKITNKGMTYLNNLPDLKIISLEGTPVTDEGIGRLSNLNNLILFYLPSNKKVTDASLPFLIHQDRIRSISINDTGISKSGVRQLFAIPNISFLGLKNLGLKDSDLPDGLSSTLTMIELSGNPITDRTIESAVPLKRLWYVDLTNCPRVSKRAIADLKAAPNRRIVLSNDKPKLSDHYIEDTRWYFEPAVYDLLKNNPAALRTKVTEWQFPEVPFRD